MSDFCLWALALGTAPLLMGALWDQFQLHYRRSV